MCLPTRGDCTVSAAPRRGVRILYRSCWVRRIHRHPYLVSLCATHLPRGGFVGSIGLLAEFRLRHSLQPAFAAHGSGNLVCGSCNLIHLKASTLNIRCTVYVVNIRCSV